MLPRHALEMGCFPAISINGAAHRTNRISVLDADVVRSDVERWVLLPRSDVYSRP
jgi:hypothetical protein